MISRWGARTHYHHLPFLLDFGCSATPAHSMMCAGVINVSRGIQKFKSYTSLTRCSFDTRPTTSNTKGKVYVPKKHILKINRCQWDSVWMEITSSSFFCVLMPYVVSVHCSLLPQLSCRDVGRSSRALPLCWRSMLLLYIHSHHVSHANHFVAPIC